MALHQIFTHEQLSAYVDGETDLTPVSDIDRALIQDPELAKRIETLRTASDLFAQYFRTLSQDRPGGPKGLPRKPHS